MQWFSKVGLPLPPNHPPSFKNLGLGKGSQNKLTPTKFTSLIPLLVHVPLNFILFLFYLLVIIQIIPCTKLNTIHVLEFKCTKKDFLQDYTISLTSYSSINIPDHDLKCVSYLISDILYDVK